jgi:hypothetical protein
VRKESAAFRARLERRRRLGRASADLVKAQWTGSGLSAATIQSMDLETALMMVQSQRANLLEQQLKDQIAVVAAQNATIANLQTAQSRLLAVIGRFPAESDRDTKTSAVGVPATALADLKAAVIAAGLQEFDTSTLGALNTARNDIAALIDSRSNSQQMDMLRLQSLSNKRNEAFDLMTNFLKKMQDARSSIIGNMR